MKSCWLLTIQGGRWVAAGCSDDKVTLFPGPGYADDDRHGDGTSAAEQLSAFFQDIGCRGDSLCLALPSEMIFTARVSCDGLPRRQRHTAMLYRLEEHLPLDAEVLTAEFLPPQSMEAMAVAAATDRVRKMIDSLEQAGSHVECVYPLALLALWQHRRNYGQAGYCLVVGNEAVDVFRFRAGQPANWQTAPDEPEAIARTIQAELLEFPLTQAEQNVCVVAPPEWQLPPAIERLGLKVAWRQDEPAVTAAARALPSVLVRQHPAWGNLRRDALAAGGHWGRCGALLKTAVASILLLLATASATALLRAARYQAEAEAARTVQAEVYAEIYPDSPVPPAVTRRLAAEHERLAGVSGAAEQVPDQPDMLDTLRRIVAGLPASMRLRILELQVSPADVFLQGEARSHADAEAVKKGLDANGLAMEPPQTQRLGSGGVAFTLTGAVRQPEARP